MWGRGKSWGKTRRMRVWARALGLAFGLSCVGSGPGCAAPPDEAPGAIRELSRLPGEIQESSGLVASRSHAGVFWTHNDSGDRPRIFAIRKTGELLGEFQIDGAEHVDWEDIAIDSAGYLYLADFGNNRSRREDLVVYKVREPNPIGSRRSVSVERALRFRYANQILGSSPPDFDAEALVWSAGALYIFTKHRSDTRSEVFRLEDVPSVVPQVLEPLGSLEMGAEGGGTPFARVTAGDLREDGQRLALLTYDGLHLYAPAGPELWPLESLGRIALSPLQVQQAESLAWDGDALIFGNEQRQLFRIDAP